MKQRTPQREEYVHNVIDAVEADLRDLRIRGRVMGRPKQLYSVYQKMVVRGREFDDIYDLIGIRVLVGTVRDCYAVLGSIHARWTPIPGRFKDYIATPKFNLYQSLHTTVIGPGGRTVEIQIRTNEMHQQAEYGVAAHWKYKERMAGGKSDTKAVDTDMAWIAHISDWQAETADPGEFLDSLRFEIGAKEVYVFTPKGRVIGLPAGGTPVDFAYAVHTEVGHRTMGAKVNGRLVPLESELHSGDVVEVFTSKNPDAGPSQDWLSFVKSTRARNKIRGWFTKERREEAVEQGKGRHRAGHAPPEPAAAAPDEPGLVHRGRPPTALRGRHRPVRRRRRGPRVDAVGDREGHGARQFGGGTPPPARSRFRTSAARKHPAAATRVSWCAARRTSSSSSPSAARRYRATTSSASSRVAAECPCTGRTARTCDPFRTIPIA